MIIITEWPVYLRDGRRNSKQTKGDVNIITLGSNVTNYTLILEMYNFTSNKPHLFRIGQKLRAIFLTDVACFTGCRQKGDYTTLQVQYPSFNLPNEAKNKMECVSLMALNRDLAKRGRGTTTLQALCKGQQWHLPKPANVRVGTVFDSRGTLSMEAKRYCQLDVEAPLLLHSIYAQVPDMTKRATTQQTPGHQ